MTSQARLSQVRGLVDQWEPFVGFDVHVGEDIIQMLADAGVDTLYDLGQWMFYHGQGVGGGGSGAVGIGGKYPWAAFGMSHETWHLTTTSLNDAWTQMTGQLTAPPDLIAQALTHFGGTEIGGSQFRDFLLTNQSILNTYGWLRYGLDYQQFQQQKLTMASAFGRDLTDAEASAQLRYFHSAQGSNQIAAVQPTFSQQERRQAQQGITGNPVR